MTNTELLLRLVLAALLGSVIGVEREPLQWAAGLRTHMLASEQLRQANGVSARR